MKIPARKIRISILLARVRIRRVTSHSLFGTVEPEPEA